MQLRLGPYYVTFTRPCTVVWSRAGVRGVVPSTGIVVIYMGVVCVGAWCGQAGCGCVRPWV